MLIDNLLSFLRMGRNTKSFQPVEPEPLVNYVIREIEPDLEGRNIAWHIGNIPAVVGEAAMLRIVLANLIANAFNFTRHRRQPK